MTQCPICGDCHPNCDREGTCPVVEPDGVPEGMDPVERLARLADAIIAETGTDGDTAAQLAGNLIRKARRRP